MLKTLIGIVASAIVLAGVMVHSSAAQPSACDRQCLEGFVDRYLDAVVKHDPKAAPIAATARYTENGQRLAIGDGLWRSVKSRGSYRLFVSDVEVGQVAFIGTLEEHNADPAKGTPALIALRLKVADGAITEIEQFIARSHDAAQRVEALGKPHTSFTQTVPVSERMSRADLIATANKSSRGFATGVSWPSIRSAGWSSASCSSITQRAIRVISRRRAVVR